MDRKIVNCISTIDEYDSKFYKEEEVGLELQDFVEPNLSDNEVKSKIQAYKEHFIDFNNIKSMHGPFLDLKPASPDKDIRRVSQKKYFETLDIAEDLSLDYIIFHSQINPLLNEPGIMELNYSQNAQFYNSLMKETSFKGIVLIENIFEANPYGMLKLIEKIDSDRVKLILDIGHAKLGESSLEEWIKTLANHIAYIHFHSNNGKYDQHLRPSNEEIEELFNLIDKYQIDPVISLEYKKENLSEEIKRYKG